MPVWLILQVSCPNRFLLVALLTPLLPLELKAQLDVTKYESGVAKRELELANRGLGEAKRKLDEANRELGATKHELTTERKLRQDAQNALDDIRREAKEPFIIPGLLDAFLSVSSLADKIH